MSQLLKDVRLKPTSRTATAKSAAQFEAARRSRVPGNGENRAVVVSLKDSTPGALLIGAAIAEAIFVEPIRSIRRKFRRNVA